MTYELQRKQLSRIATRQHGRVSAQQLLAIGFTRSTIEYWVAQGLFTRVLPHVYAVGHIARNRKADLWAAILYAGPGAAISHATAAYHRGLIDYPSSVIEIVTNRQVKSVPGVVRVYGERSRDRELVDDIPTSLIPDTIVDTAATGTPRIVKRALAQLDYRRQLTPTMIEAIEARCGRGRAGSAVTRKALKHHKPQYAHTNSDLEDLFVDLCAKWRKPLPRCNIKLYGITVDAYWPMFRLVVEVDGNGNHATDAQVDRDRTNDLTLRAHGLTVLRYSRRQLQEDRKSIRKDLHRHMQPSTTQTELRAA